MLFSQRNKRHISFPGFSSDDSSVFHSSRQMLVESSNATVPKSSLRRVKSTTILPVNTDEKFYYCHEVGESLSALHVVSKRGDFAAIQDIVTQCRIGAPDNNASLQQPQQQQQDQQLSLQHYALLLGRQTLQRGDSPLMYAVGYGHENIVEYLLDLYPQAALLRGRGTFCNTCSIEENNNKTLKTPLHLAIEMNAPVEMIRTLAFSKHIKNNNSNGNSSEKMVGKIRQQLLKTRDNKGRTPYDLAVQKYHPPNPTHRNQILTLLQERSRSSRSLVQLQQDEDFITNHVRQLRRVKSIR